MKIRKNLFLTTALAAILGVGAFIGTSSIKSEKPTKFVEATDTTYTGSIGFEFQWVSGWNYYWDDANAKIACYLWDDNDHSGWTSMIVGDGSHHASIPYSFPFDPYGCTMNIVRFNSNHSDTPDWSNIWARIDNVTFGQVIYIFGSDNGSASSKHCSPTYLGFNSFGSSDQVYNRLSFTTYNSSSNFEFYRTGLTLSQGDYGKVALDGSEWCNATHDVSTDYFWIDYAYDTNNLVCNYYGDSYDVYFDITNKNSYISIPDRAVAEKWGKTFLDTITCTGTAPGATTFDPDAWNKTMKNAYDAMTPSQQGKVWTASANESGTYLEQAAYRYDYILRKYGTSTYSNFVNRTISSGSIMIGMLPLSSNNATTTVIIVVVSSVAIAAVGGYFLFKKKKQD